MEKYWSQSLRNVETEPDIDVFARGDDISIGVHDGGKKACRIHIDIDEAKRLQILLAAIIQRAEEWKIWEQENG